MKLMSMKNPHDSDIRDRESAANLHENSCYHSFSGEELVLQLGLAPPAKHLVMVVKKLYV